MQIISTILTKFRDWLLDKQSQSIETIHVQSNPIEVQIFSDEKLKFIERGQINYYVENDDGLVHASTVLKTVEYDAFELILSNGMTLVGADDHLVFSTDGWKTLKDLSANDTILTDVGMIDVLSISKTNHRSNMFDLSIDDDSHSYFTNGILSHNTTVIAVYLLWFACFHFDKYILVASNKNAGAVDIMNRIRYAYEELPNWLKPGSAYYNKHAMEFDNGSMIVSSATTENTGRGRAISLLMLDELAFVPRRIQDEMWASLAPTLSTGGSCIISSTPNGDQDLFAQLWRGAVFGDNGFASLEVLWDEHPDRDEHYKEEMIKKIGEEKWRQEYACDFLSSDPLLINSLTLIALKAKAPLFTDKGFLFWKEPRFTQTYVIGVDVAEGVNKDFSTIQVVELETMEQIAEFRSNSIKEAQLYSAIKWIINKLLSYACQKTGKKPIIYWSFENNSAGAAINTLYWQDEFFPADAELISAQGDRGGMRTSNKPKLEACRHLKNLVEKARSPLVVNSSLLIMEFKNYVATGASYAAKPGATDDLVSAMLIVIRVIKQLAEYEPDVFEKLYTTGEDFYEEGVGDEYDEPVPFVV